MVYKLGNVSDLSMLPKVDDETMRNLYEYTMVLSTEYGSDRNVDTDDGGYVLYAPPGTNVEEIKAYFDYTQNTVEYVNTSRHVCSAVYLTHNEYAVVIVMSLADAPEEIKKEIEDI